ncbi:hypothetical protein NM688_g1743 [Phlebia brevispora]|uniref:Uncharacterized protein n=1 Tax=Phlebia brevispora TaxID=194682 RepID=A0ACC1TAG0_9APHY|nr:hypothetical protein NM688_g1743 [Phlebia brevispora]
MSSAAHDDTKIIGLVLLARHGDREGFYQDPFTYTPSQTSITPLGEVEEFQLGTFLRSIYANPRSPDNLPLNPLFNQSQVQVRADAGGEAGVIYDSSIALLQGFFPPTTKNQDTLANGSTIVAPLGGYQYIPIESVEPNEDVSLEGFTSCPNLDTHTAAFYNSSLFAQVAAQAAPFLDEFAPLCGWQGCNPYAPSIHNATFAKRLPPTFLAQAYALANFHEYGVFSDVAFDGIGNIAFRTVAPTLITAFNRITNASDGLVFHYSAISYKPFISLFNMSGVVELNEIVGGVVDYAAAVVFEVRESPSLGTVLRFKFKNGTKDPDFHTYNLKFPGWDQSGDVPLNTFIDAFAPAGVNTTTEWCNICGQTTLRNCANLKGVPGPADASLLLETAPSSTAVSGVEGTCLAAQHDPISPVGAGFMGAGLALAVVAIMLSSLAFFGCFSFGTKKTKRSASNANHGVVADFRSEAPTPHGREDAEVSSAAGAAEFNHHERARQATTPPSSALLPGLNTVNLRYLLEALSAPSAMSQLLGIVIWARHGDREGFYQDPVTYTASETAITPLGEVQELQLGQFLHSTYLDPTSDSYIGTSFPLFNQTQVQVRADASDEGFVILDSAQAVVQGLWPNTTINNVTLANGSTIVSPMSGYQYIPIESVEADEDVSLEGFTDCNTQATRTTQFYNSAGFQQVANESAAFLNSLPPFLDGRPVTLENMFNIWDYMNVQSIHNQTFFNRLPNGYLAEARALANYHEYGVFSDQSFNGIGNIAARTAVPSMITAMQRIVNASDGLKLHYSAMSYKPFLSFFNMSGVVETGQLPGA